MLLTTYYISLLVCVAGGMWLTHCWVSVWIWVHGWVGVAAKNTAARHSATNWPCRCHAVCFPRSQTGYL